MGGHDVREYKLDSLMKNISMVFQLSLIHIYPPDVPLPDDRIADVEMHSSALPDRRAAAVTSVSYTHLDVYKRQGLHVAAVLFQTCQRHFCGPHQLQKPDDLQREDRGRDG